MEVPTVTMRHDRCEMRPVFRRVVLAAALLIVTTAWRPVRAEPRPAAPVTAKAASPKPELRRQPSRNVKPAPSKVKPRAAPKPKPATPDVKQSSTANATAAEKSTQVMDFDNEQVEGQRMEPGFELIEGAPRRARQPSLVKPLRPEDSVVGR
jgi:hypothetical protein